MFPSYRMVTASHIDPKISSRKNSKKFERKPKAKAVPTYGLAKSERDCEQENVFLVRVTSQNPKLKKVTETLSGKSAVPSLSIHIYTSKSILSIVCELQGSLPVWESFQVRGKKQRKTENILKSEEGLSRSHTLLWWTSACLSFRLHLLFNKP